MPNRIVVNADQAGPKISRHIYGHFAEHLGRCVYEGLWVGEESSIPNTRGFRNDVVSALKKIKVPNLRWPGGCFADTYHWMDGIGPREQRPSIVNIHWGGTTENNHCGTHEFLDLCQLLNCEPYIAGNMGSGTVREMSEWLEYLTMPGESPMANLRRKNGRQNPWDVSFWGVGNENWGCGGNMRVQHYVDLYRQYASYCRNFSPDKKLYKVACGFNDDWNEVLIREAGRFLDGLSVHYYTVPGDWGHKGSSTNFTVDEWRITLQKANNILGFINSTAAILDRYDPTNRIGIVMDEWGTWYDVEPGTNPGFLYQQNTIRDALVAGLSLNIFNNSARRVQVANIAQMVNVLQAVILTEGPKMVLTPTYHVFDMYKAHQDAALLPTHVETEEYVPHKEMPATPSAPIQSLLALPQISTSASRDAAGVIHVTICNLHHEQDVEAECELRGVEVKKVSGRILTSKTLNEHNTFESPDCVAPASFGDYKLHRNSLTLKLPARSVVALEIHS